VVKRTGDLEPLGSNCGRSQYFTHLRMTGSRPADEPQKEIFMVSPGLRPRDRQSTDNSNKAQFRIFGRLSDGDFDVRI
jgi:hypothetical protein